MMDNQTLPDNLSETDLFAIIVAGGSGSRMKSDVPKQFLLLNGKPILQHTIEQFQFVRMEPFDSAQQFRSVRTQTGEIDSAQQFRSVRTQTGEALSLSPRSVSSQTGTQAIIKIILVLPANDLPVWEQLCREHDFHPPVQTVIGGATRFQSVRNGLSSIPASEGLVAVHDGVRPFVSPEIILNSFRTAARTGSAVACVPVKDSVRVMDADGTSHAVDRSQYRLVQTPQTFRLSAFRQAFQSPEQPFFTDCASVMEHAGYLITLIEGSYGNIKITTPDDLPKPF